jgi:hypothetical protein
MNCGPGHMQCIYSSAYTGHNIQLNLTAQLLEICRHLDARYAATLMGYIAHTLQFTFCELWSRTYTKHLRLRMFRIQYSTVDICIAIVDITSILCALYCKLGAKCSAHSPAFAMWTVVPHIYKVYTAPHIYASTFDGTYLLCYWRYSYISKPTLLQIGSQI